MRSLIALLVLAVLGCGSNPPPPQKNVMKPLDDLAKRHDENAKKRP